MACIIIIACAGNAEAKHDSNVTTNGMPRASYREVSC